jgi:uncharacterized protein YmfQ (DUF2313 family)
MARSLEEQTQSLAGWLPIGRVWAARNVAGSVLRKLLRGLAHELVRASVFVNQLRAELMPGTTTVLIREWESTVGIPSACFRGTGTLSERQRDVITKLASLGVQTASEFEHLAQVFGFDVDVNAGAVHGLFPMEFPIVFFETQKDARFTIIVWYDYPESLKFPYIFPITFRVAGLDVLECVFSVLKPANCDLLFMHREDA